MTRLLAFALLLAPVAVAAQTVEVAETDWSYLPRLQHINNNHLDDISLAGAADVIERGDCVIPGQSAENIDLTVPFAAQFSPDGTLKRVVLKKLGCPQVEGIIAGALLPMLKGGDYRPVGRNPDGWYRGEFSFASSS